MDIIREDSRGKVVQLKRIRKKFKKKVNKKIVTK
jgi:hypothetical protein